MFIKDDLLPTKLHHQAPGNVGYPRTPVGLDLNKHKTRI